MSGLNVPLFLMRLFHLKELHMLNKGHRNGLSSCRFSCRLGCHPGSRFGCTLGGFGLFLPCHTLVPLGGPMYIE